MSRPSFTNWDGGAEFLVHIASGVFAISMPLDLFGEERMRMNWNDLNSRERLRAQSVSRNHYDERSAFENDYDRVIFCSSVRRLQDKTQVFPLETHDFIRTRLTHTLEVAAIGRAMATSTAKILGDQEIDKTLDRFDAGMIVETACILHDLGNPPFGHSGERSMGDFFRHCIKDGRLSISDPQEIEDLRRFEGNAQAFRVATRLQSYGDEFGINLTAGTLAVNIKYPIPSTQTDPNGGKSRQKFGHFKSDQYAFERVQDLTKLHGKRHPLCFLMEAADDIVYSAVDIEDAHKKRLVEFDVVVDYLMEKLSGKARDLVEEQLHRRYKELRNRVGLTDAKQFSIQRLRQVAVGHMAASCVKVFLEQYDAIMEGGFDRALSQEMELKDISEVLVQLAKEHVYKKREVVAVEFAGKSVIWSLLDILLTELKRGSSSSLVAAFFHSLPLNEGDERSDCSNDYLLAQRAADYVAGMTDTYAVRLHQQLTGADV